MHAAPILRSGAVGALLGLCLNLPACGGGSGVESVANEALAASVEPLDGLVDAAADDARRQALKVGPFARSVPTVAEMNALFAQARAAAEAAGAGSGVGAAPVGIGGTTSVSLTPTAAAVGEAVSEAGGAANSETAPDRATPANPANPASPATTNAATNAATTDVARPASALAASATLAAAVQPAVLAQGDATAPTAQLGAAAQFKALNQAFSSPQPTSQGLGAVAGCRFGYRPASGLTATQPAPAPASGGTFYSNVQLTAWRSRIASGPFVKDGDQQRGSPGDWNRIVANARAVVARAEPALGANTPTEQRDTHGIQARDAAFHFLLTGDAASGNAARTHLAAQAANPANDFAATLCITTPDGTTYDAWFHQAAWLLRHAVAYDFVRASMSAAQRLAVENWLRRNAWFLAAHTDWGIANIFPERQAGNYSQRRDAAAASTDAEKWFTRRHDTNGDCRVDGEDSPTPLRASTYVRADGSAGPRISVLSQYFNNRKSTAAAAFGAVGVLLGDATLVASAKRYFMEWLTYSVWPDGSQGEYLRNGDYCIAPQGVIYASLNLQGAALLARVLARQGDTSLTAFATSDGLFGSEGGGTAKSLQLAASTYFKLSNGQLAWFAHEPWKTTQAPRPATALGNNTVNYLGSSRPMDDFHELGLLPIAYLMNGAPLAAWILREPQTTALRFPGATGNPVATGLGQWSDAFNAMPAVLLLRP